MSYLPLPVDPVILAGVGLVLAVLVKASRAAGAGGGSHSYSSNGSTSPADEAWMARHGWWREGSVWRGRYRTGFDSYEGKIEMRSGVPMVFIRHPPPWMLVGRHSICIHPKASGFYYIHENRPQPSLPHAVAAVETFLLEKVEELP